MDRIYESINGTKIQIPKANNWPNQWIQTSSWPFWLAALGLLTFTTTLWTNSMCSIYAAHRERDNSINQSINQSDQLIWRLNFVCNTYSFYIICVPSFLFFEGIRQSSCLLCTWKILSGSTCVSLNPRRSQTLLHTGHRCSFSRRFQLRERW